MSQPRVVVVTGASRGAGRGIASALGSHGCTVYVTGRSEKAGHTNLSGTIHETARAVTDAGGRGIAVRVDHAKDQEVKALFEQIEREQGRLDILVNNACAIHDQLTSSGNFWEKPLEPTSLSAPAERGHGSRPIRGHGGSVSTPSQSGPDPSAQSVGRVP